MKEMDITQHFTELRRTAINIALIVMVAFFICYGLGGPISEFLLLPLRQGLAAGQFGEVVYLGVLDKVVSQLQVAFWTSLIISSPLWFYQIWKFVKPGLHPHEIKVVRPFILIGFVFFCLGVAFGRFLVFPLTFETLMHFGVEDIKAAISLKEYLALASKVLVFLGLVFQLPNVLLILGFMGLVPKQSLRGQRRYIYVGLAALSALLTPPDPVTMMGLLLPLAALFELGVLGVAVIVHPWLARRQKERP